MVDYTDRKTRKNLYEGSCMINAGMAELADALDLGSSVLRRAGSSPVARTLVRGKLVQELE